MKSALLVGTLLLVGCSSTNGAVLPTVQGKFDQLPTPEQIAEDIKDKRVEINQFVYNDILRAQEIALEPPVDQVAAACYPALAAKVKKRMDGNSTNAIGAISAFEKANKVLFQFGAPDDSLKVACTALRDRTVRKIVEIVAKIGALVASGGIAGVADLDGAKKILGVLHEMGVSIID